MPYQRDSSLMVVGIVALLCAATMCRSLPSNNLSTDSDPCTCFYNLRNTIDAAGDGDVLMGPMCLNSSKTRAEQLSCAEASVKSCDSVNNKIHEEMTEDLDRVCKQDCDVYLTLESGLKTCWEKLATEFSYEKFELFCSVWAESQRCIDVLAGNCSNAMMQMALNMTVTKDQLYALLKDTAEVICDPACTDLLQNYTMCKDFVATIRDNDLTHCSARHGQCVFTPTGACRGFFDDFKTDLLVDELKSFNDKCNIIEAMTTKGYTKQVIEFTGGQTSGMTRTRPMSSMPSSMLDTTYTSERPTSDEADADFSSSRVSVDATTIGSTTAILSGKVDTAKQGDGWVPCNKVESKTVCRSLEILPSNNRSNTDSDPCTCFYNLRNTIDVAGDGNVLMGPMCLNSSKTRAELLSCAEASVKSCDSVNSTIHKEMKKDLDSVCKQDCAAYLTLESGLKTCWEKLATANEAYLYENFERFCSVWTESERCTDVLAQNCSNAMMQMVLNMTVTKDQLYAQLKDTAAAICDTACADLLQNYTMCKGFVATIRDSYVTRCSARHGQCVFTPTGACRGFFDEVKADLLIDDHKSFNDKCNIIEAMTTEGYTEQVIEFTGSQTTAMSDINGSSDTQIEKEAKLVSSNGTGEAFTDNTDQTRNKTEFESMEPIVAPTTDVSATSSEQFTSGMTRTRPTSSMPSSMLDTTYTSERPTSDEADADFSSSRVSVDATTIGSTTAILSGKVDSAKQGDGWVPCNKVESKTGESHGAASRATLDLITRLWIMVSVSILIACDDRFLG